MRNYAVNDDRQEDPDDERQDIALKNYGAKYATEKNRGPHRQKQKYRDPVAAVLHPAKIFVITFINIFTLSLSVSINLPRVKLVSNLLTNHL